MQSPLHEISAAPTAYDLDRAPPHRDVRRSSRSSGSPSSSCCRPWREWWRLRSRRTTARRREAREPSRVDKGASSTFIKRTRSSTAIARTSALRGRRTYDGQSCAFSRHGRDATGRPALAVEIEALRPEEPRGLLRTTLPAIDRGDHAEVHRASRGDGEGRGQRGRSGTLSCSFERQSDDARAVTATRERSRCAGRQSPASERGAAACGARCFGHDQVHRAVRRTLRDGARRLARVARASIEVLGRDDYIRVAAAMNEMAERLTAHQAERPPGAEARLDRPSLRRRRARDQRPHRSSSATRASSGNRARRRVAVGDRG